MIITMIKHHQCNADYDEDSKAKGDGGSLNK
jgi:hypothetical protein